MKFWAAIPGQRWSIPPTISPGRIPRGPGWMRTHREHPRPRWIRPRRPASNWWRCFVSVLNGCIVREGGRAMREESAAIAAPAEASHAVDERFDQIESALRAGGPVAALDRLAAELDARGDYRAMLDALLLQARHELGMPLIATGSLANLPEPLRGQFEERYVEAIRRVGQRYLEAGDIPTAWAYYRVIAEPEPVARAIGDFKPSDSDDKLGPIIEVAFNHGVSPRRGFDLILEHYGTCPSISAFEQLPPGDEALRAACAERLIAHLHKELVANLRSEIAARGQLLPAEGSSIAELVPGREWLFSDESYHIDTSHLAAVVRFSLLVSDPHYLALAVDLTEYGRRLSPRLQFDGAAPFQKIFDDHRNLPECDPGSGRRSGDRALPGRSSARCPREWGPIRRCQPRCWSICSSRWVGSTRRSTWRPSTWRVYRTRRCLARRCRSSVSAPASPMRLAQLARDHGNLVDFTAAASGRE